MTKGRLTRAGFKYDLEIFRDQEAAFLRLVTERNVYVEVKSDQQCSRGYESGNVFVEYRQDPEGTGLYRPSGISTTQADYWAEEFDDDCWVVTPVERIRYLLKHWHGRGRRRYGGDNDRFKGVLIPITSIVYPKQHGISIPKEPTR